MIDSSHGWSGAQHGELGHAARRSKRDRGGERLAGLLGAAHEARMRDLLRQIDLEPVGRIMQRDIGVDLRRRPIRQLGPELRLRHRDALGAIDLGEAAGEHRLGLVVERADELRLPAVPHARPDRLDVGGGQNGEQLHALDRLHHRGEILDRHPVGEIARLRDARHHQVHLDQPGDRLGLRRREAEPRAEAARDPRAGDRVVLDAALGDVVQEQRDVEQRAMLRLDRAHQLGGERRVVAATGLDVGEDADAAQQMLVHRVVVIHVELHHRDDAAEGGHELAEHAGLVHPAQHGLGVVLRGEDLEEQPVRLLVLAQLAVDQLERAGGDVHRVGVEAPDCISAPDGRCGSG